MLLEVLKILSSFVFALGFLFLLMEFVVKFDRRFLLFGVSLILLNAIAGIDIWFIPQFWVEGEIDLVIWLNNLFHMAAFIYIPISLALVYLVCGRERKVVYYLFVMLSLTGIPLFLMVDMFVPADFMHGYVGTNLYYIFIVPFFVLYTSYIVWLLHQGYVSSSGAKKRLILQMLVGYGLLFAFAFLDLGLLFGLKFLQGVDSYMIFGLFAFAFTNAFAFFDVFVGILKNKERYQAEIKTAFVELDRSWLLEKAGHSTHLIRHEIKNGAAMLRGNMSLLVESRLNSEASLSLKALNDPMERIETFSRRLSETEVGRFPVEESVDINDLVRGLDGRSLSSRLHTDLCGEPVLLHGEEKRLKEMMLQLLKNAEEAGAQNIDVRTLSYAHRKLIVVEDDGAGGREEDLPKFFDLSFSSKGSLGLGLKLVQSTVKRCGGNISVYTKNASGSKGATGIVVVLSFVESAGNHPHTRLPECAILSNRPSRELLQIFSHLRIAPLIYSEADFTNGEVRADLCLVDSHLGFLEDGVKKVFFVERTKKQVYFNHRVEEKQLVTEASLLRMMQTLGNPTVVAN